MQPIIEWARSNPVLMAALVWPALTFVLTAVFGPHSDEQLAKYPAWFSAALRFCGALGVDVPKLVDLFKQAFGSKDGAK
jgi:hypothetical protein